jgi:hypothetical protein
LNDKTNEVCRIARKYVSCKFEYTFTLSLNWIAVVIQNIRSDRLCSRGKTGENISRGNFSDSIVERSAYLAGAKIYT